MKTIDADAIIARATPAGHQQAYEIQPFNHLVKMPSTLAYATEHPHHRASAVTAERDRGAERVDGVAGSEFVDDRIRLRE